MNSAPYFAFKRHDNAYGVVQGCCNSWTCPRCGILRAKHEYGRIVEGCRKLSETHELYFITITCKGREITVNDAEIGYPKWTNTILTRWRTFAKRHNQEWCYIQVTERQKRGHPHSHILTTFKPHDLVSGFTTGWSLDNAGIRRYERKEALRSAYVLNSCVDVGLGSQYDISRVESIEGASRYVAKYLFKPTIFTTNWPDHWRRVRYSQNFPKLEQQKTDAFVLLSLEDWRKLDKLATVISVNEYVVGEIVKHHMPHTTVKLIEQKVDKT